MVKEAKEEPKKLKDEEREAFWHSTSHVLADAVKRLWPSVKLGIGPAIKEGFYYDFDRKEPFTAEDLVKIEIEMKKIVKENLKFEQVKMPRKEAEASLKKGGEKYKLDLLTEIPDKEVSFYKHGEFIDLCKGPVIRYTSQIKAIKLLTTSTAYWKGDSNKPVLHRIYGISFPSQKELDEYLVRQEEIKKRAHKKIGQELELFFFDETAPGMAYWLPKGLVIYNTLLDFWRTEHNKRGYHETKTPLLNKKELYETSGHWQHYLENMFIIKTKEDETYCLKPMNCPNAMIIYKLRPRSYRELPLRLSDADAIHRSELSGTLSGLFRVREFQQDDAHIFIKESQIEEEYKRIFEIVEKFYSVFNLGYSFRLGTRPKEFMGDSKVWDKAEKILKKILESSGKKFIIGEGEGAFYGPKIDILMKDSLDREWQMGTIQLDFQLPQRFNLKYVDDDGREKTPVIIHRVIYGSLERFIGILIENYAGALPIWISPVQVRILPIADRHADYAEKVKNELADVGIRVEVDNNQSTTEYKIRDASLQKIPFMVVVGDKEEQNNTVAVRTREDSKVKYGVPLKDFVKEVQKLIKEKK